MESVSTLIVRYTVAMCGGKCFASIALDAEQIELRAINLCSSQRGSTSTAADQQDVVSHADRCRCSPAQISATATLPPGPAVCSEDWVFFNGMCYFISSEYLDWSRSREDCLTKESQLLVIDDHKEMTCVGGESTLNTWGVNKSSCQPETLILLLPGFHKQHHKKQKLPLDRTPSQGTGREVDLDERLGVNQHM
ncbi:hypothetical protein NDU88_000631 [Pleurodeles waltl]|uniref:C-type lectin domain-containing protein n=1 Tax=Pleurodeles waltl TaxID=8319 RepID=A0AAV7P1K5_PLEWA|nr:hypothetical protein NDU88_000631 [Pleurodeles waltl]